MKQLKPFCCPHGGSHPQQHQHRSRCLQIIEAHNVTNMCAAPVVLNMLVNTRRSDPLRNPVNILTGGAPPHSSVFLRADKFTARSKGYGFVTFKDPESAMRACENPNPIIDGRRANCNLAVLGAQKNRPTTPQPQHEVVEGMKKTRSSSIPFINTYFHHYNPQYALIPYSTYGYPIYQQDNNVALMNYNYTGYGGWGQQQHYYPYPGVYYYPCVPVQAQPGHNSPTTSNPRPKLQSLPLALPTTTVTGTYSNFGLYSN